MKIIKSFFKTIFAGALAIVILSLLLCTYSLTPVHHDNEKGNTDYVWPANSVWVKLTEGISFGRFDGQGFNNKEVVDNPDIIVLGSSQMEATNVMQDENVTAVLSDSLKNQYSVYNMGISSHDLFKVSSYLPVTLSLYEAAPKLVIIESAVVDVTRELADSVVDADLTPIKSYNGGVIGTLQRIPFFREVYHQISRGLLALFLPGNSSAYVGEEGIIKTEESPVDESAYRDYFSYLADLEDRYDTEILIFYHPKETLLDDGSIEFESGEKLDEFNKMACEYGITFLDMTDDFVKMYEEEHHVPHGFVTGELASGHLNKYGHACIANAILRTMEEMGGFDLCR